MWAKAAPTTTATRAALICCHWLAQKPRQEPATHVNQAAMTSAGPPSDIMTGKLRKSDNRGA